MAAKRQSYKTPFIEQHTLNPVETANDYTIIRRLYFDLIGLPPSIAQIKGYINDTSENKYEKLVDKFSNVTILSRTHGQPASPTTMGKELDVFYHIKDN